MILKPDGSCTRAAYLNAPNKRLINNSEKVSLIRSLFFVQDNKN